jgi:hypothetical protein
VAEFDSSGKHLWSKQLSGEDAQHADGVAVDSTGNVLILGRFMGTIHIDSEQLVSAGETDIFVAKFDLSGKYLWSQRFGDADPQGGSFGDHTIGVDSGESILLTGKFWGTLDFGGAQLVAGSNNAASFITKLDSSGKHLWSLQFPVSADGIAANASGNVMVTGRYSDTVDFGSGPFTSAGGDDIFLVKLAP